MVLPFCSVTPVVVVAVARAAHGLPRRSRDLPRRLIVFGHRACNGGTDGGRSDTCFVCAAVLFRPRVNIIKDLLSNENYCNRD